MEINFLSDYDSNEPIINGLSYKYSPQSGFSKSEQGYDGRILNGKRIEGNSQKALCKHVKKLIGQR